MRFWWSQISICGYVVILVNKASLIIGDCFAIAVMDAREKCGTMNSNGSMFVQL